VSQSELLINAAGLTDTGLVRDENQDCIHIDPAMGLYIVLDGMGGHRGGATAARLGREVMTDLITKGYGNKDPAQLLVDACKAANAAVHKRSNQDHELRGMGTTGGAILMPQPDVAIIGHVGDSRAYLLRGQRLQRLTSDHTIVAELVAAGRISPEQAVDHPHASVLSRNLGGHSKTDVDVSVLHLMPGDRVLMCSDGLNGYAAQGAIEHVLGGAVDAGAATQDLVDLAKRGGGGDNVSVIVIEYGAQTPGPRANILHETGARAWWERRALFMDVAERMGLASSELTAGFAPHEALEVLAGTFFEAIYHDLENTTGVNVWTYADSLVKGWFNRGGDYRQVQELLDALRASAIAVVKDISATDEDFGVCLEISLLRSFIVTEMVVGGEIGAKIRTGVAELVATEARDELPDATFASVATLPFQGAQSPLPAGPDVSSCLQKGFESAQEQLPDHRQPLIGQVLQACHVAALEYSGEADMATLARELYGNRLLSELELNPIIETAESCRLVHMDAVGQQDYASEARVTAYRAVARAHQAFAHAIALVAIDAGKPTTDRLRGMQDGTVQMRERLTRNDKHLGNLEMAIETVEQYV
jgi:protein phosphatase